MTRYVELRRHTDNDGDRLTPQGIADAEAIAGRLSPPYIAFVSTGWRDAAKAAGKGADVEAIRRVDPELVERESWLLGLVLRQLIEGLPEGGRALVVGHSPTNEAAVLGLTGRVIPALGKGEGVLVTNDAEHYRTEPLT